MEQSHYKQPYECRGEAPGRRVSICSGWFKEERRAAVGAGEAPSEQLPEAPEPRGCAPRCLSPGGGAVRPPPQAPSREEGLCLQVLSYSFLHLFNSGALFWVLCPPRASGDTE